MLRKYFVMEILQTFCVIAIIPAYVCIHTHAHARHGPPYHRSITLWFSVSGIWAGVFTELPGCFNVHPGRRTLLSVVVLRFFSCLFILERERAHKRGRDRERGRHRIRSRFQALSCQHRAQRRAWIHAPWDHNPSGSQMPNLSSHPGTPKDTSLDGLKLYLTTFS